MRLIFIFLSCFSSFTFSTNWSQFKWKKRIVLCSQKNYINQKKEFHKNKKLIKELKLILLSNKSIQHCELIGLDGTVKLNSQKHFSLSQLTQVINQMPMRRQELNL